MDRSDSRDCILEYHEPGTSETERFSLVFRGTLTQYSRMCSLIRERSNDRLMILHEYHPRDKRWDGTSVCGVLPPQRVHRVPIPVIRQLGENPLTRPTFDDGSQGCVICGYPCKDGKIVCGKTREWSGKTNSASCLQLWRNFTRFSATNQRARMIWLTPAAAEDLADRIRRHETNQFFARPEHV